MEMIKLRDEWFYAIADQSAALENPESDDSEWDILMLAHGLPQVLEDEVLWLKYHFEMPANDECAYWWLEVGGPLPDHTRIWVNYEEIDPVSDYFPPRWDITYAVAMGENVITLRINDTVTGQWRKMHVVPYPCE